MKNPVRCSAPGTCVRLCLATVAALAIGACDDLPENGTAFGGELSFFDLPGTGGAETVIPDDVPDTKAIIDGGGLGAFGSPCGSAADCESGYCVDGPTGGVCTKPCDDGCPDGWHCEPLNIGADSVYVCAPGDVPACDECETDADCPNDILRCMPVADEGRFCVTPCELVSHCVLGSNCVSLGEDLGDFCVPETGSCTCTSGVVDTTKTCEVSNDAGTCAGEMACTATGWTECDAAEPHAELCDGQDNNCDGQVDEDGAQGCLVRYADVDEDGFGVETDSVCACDPEAPYLAVQIGDCNDSTPQVFPGAPEVCNGVDDDCNGELDEELPSGECVTGDGCVGVLVCGGVQGFSCDAPPLAVEACDGIDNDCDGLVDEADTPGCTTYFEDKDGDGFGLSTTAQCLCAPLGDFDAVKPGDCNDLDDAVHPDAEEICNDKDDNCDKVSDPNDSPGCLSRFEDVDADGFGAAGKAAVCVCKALVPFTAQKAGDCDDGSALVFPDAPEVCNGTDDDCDEQTDEDLGGTPCSGANGKCLGQLKCAGAAGLVCDAPDAQEEVCDGADNDCDGFADEAGADGCTTLFEDGDGDGAGNAFAKQCLCKPVGDYKVENGDDCNDQDPFVKLGQPEVCNGKDDDCDFLVDPADSVGCQTLYADADGDGWGNKEDVKCLCKPSFPYTALKAGDCNDAAKAIFPGAVEVCNGADDNCNQQSDEGLGGKPCTQTNEFGSCQGVEVCQGFLGLQCNAATAAAEVCGDGTDNNCDGVVDEGGAVGCKTLYADKDGDGVGGPVSLCLCAAQGDFDTPLTGDCKDNDPFVAPGLTEICNNKDDDCDDVVDPPGALQCQVYYKDHDKDQFGTAADTQCLCGASGEYTALAGGDCNDDELGINPDAVEVCNGVDDNCKDGVDEGAGGGACSTKNDIGTCVGQMVCNAAGKLVCNAPEATLETCDGKDNDCNNVVDENLGGDACTHANEFGVCAGVTFCAAEAGLSCGALQPAPEACDTVDNDCNGQTDEGENGNGCTTFYKDTDSDGYGEALDSKCLCEALGQYKATEAGDCAPENKAIHPGATELCNGVDDNCKGGEDEGTGGGECNITNAFGTCKGSSVCNGSDGLECVGTAPAAEVCDGKDQNCDGTEDEGTGGAPCEVTNDVGTCEGVMVCQGETGLACGAGQAALETCDNQDNDCDGAVDEADSVGCKPFFLDLDGDGYGQDDSSQCLCGPTGKFTAKQAGDCNDEDKLTFPTADEICDKKDNNCKDGADEPGAVGCKTFLKDVDNDGWGLTDDSVCTCEAADPYDATDGGDCNDEDGSIFPGATELCDDVLQNCGGVVDAGCDDDGDDYCDLTLTTVDTPTACPKGGGDCADEDPAINPGVDEVCDGVDNDCAFGVDNGVAAPCGGCVTSCTLVAGKGGDPFDEPTGDTFTGKDGDGNIVIDVNSTNLSMLWVANSAQNTVSRINTETGKEVARYSVGINPSRTAVDSQGDCWVAARGNGRVMQIKRDIADCTDSNNDGTIQTSSDMNGNGVIDANEMLGVGEDECVGWDLFPTGQGTVARALAVGPGGGVWVGFWNSKKLVRISSATGQTTASVTLTGTGRPYGMALDSKSRLFVSARAGGTSQLVMMQSDPVGTPEYFPFAADAYGIAIDPSGTVWVAGGSTQKVFYFEPDGAKKVTPVTGLVNVGNTRGITASLDGKIFVARHTWTCKTTNTARFLSRIDGATKKWETDYDLGGKKGPIGVATGFGGTLWSVNQCSSTATKLDAATGKILGEYPTGPSPYTYSDMTGYLLKALISPSGTFSQIYEGWPTGITQWTEVNIEGLTPPLTGFAVRVRSADSLALLAQASFGQMIGSTDQNPPPWAINKTGKYLEVLVELISQAAKSTPILEKIEVKAQQVQP